MLSTTTYILCKKYADKVSKNSVHSTQVKTVVILTKAEYDALTDKDPETAYIINNDTTAIPTLGEDGKIPSSELPSYVDDVLEYENKESFPEVGESSKIYIDLSNNKTYRWSGSTYVEIGNSVVIGTTTGTAMDGKLGTDHINNTDIHVTADEKTSWDNKADASDLDDYLPLTGGSLTGELKSNSNISTGNDNETTTIQSSEIKVSHTNGLSGELEKSTLTFKNTTNNNMTIFGLGGITNANSSSSYNYKFPEKGGTFALTDDVPTVTDIYSPTSSNAMSGKALASAINELDLDSVGGDTKYISTISETNGKISAIAKDFPTIPTVNDGKLTIQKNSTTINTFTANQKGDVTIDISVPTVTDTYSATSTDGMSGVAVASAISGKADSDDLADVATSGSYSDLSDTPTKLSEFTNDITNTVIVSNTEPVSTAQKTNDIWFEVI